MAIKGGYKLIDFKDVDLKTGVETTIKGIHEAIENSYRKPLVFTGLVLDSVEKSDVFVNIANNDGSYTATIPSGTIVVTSADAVTYTVG